MVLTMYSMLQLAYNLLPSYQEESGPLLCVPIHDVIINILFNHACSYNTQYTNLGYLSSDMHCLDIKVDFWP